VCGTLAAHPEITLYESMFDSWERFCYFACTQCGSLQISEIPADLGRHYPSDYYSFSVPSGRTLHQRLRIMAMRDACAGSSVVGRMLNTIGISPSDALWIRACGVRPTTRVLDVGCGNGGRLLELAHSGLKHLTGVDPYIAQPLDIAPGIRVHRAQLSTIEGVFDLVMFHHSLEHMPEPRSILAEAARLTAPEGKILIRIPVMGTWAWRHYGADWVQLDPPRHLFTFSREGVGRIAEAVGFTVSKVIYDSTAFQFAGSESVSRRRKEKMPARAPGTSHAASAMTRGGMRRFASELNAAEDGDQGCFVLQRAGNRRA
jgi:SAM-dependent methyltransferase